MIVTSDAMNCQKETVHVIRERKAHYVLGLKGNHGDLHEEAVQLFGSTKKYGEKSYYKMEPEKNHNQVEIREFYKIKADNFLYAEGWRDIKNIVMYKKTMTDNFTNEMHEERRYYLTDLNDIELISEGIRRH